MMPATHTQETCTRNLCKSSVQETCTYISQSCTSFFWYKFLARNRTQLSALFQVTNRATWLAGQLLLCKKLWTCVKFFMQFFCTSFLHKFLERVLPALQYWCRGVLLMCQWSSTECWCFHAWSWVAAAQRRPAVGWALQDNTAKQNKSSCQNTLWTSLSR